MNDRHFGTVVIGGSQSGLAAGYYLKQRDLSFVIVDEHDRIGDAWRKRWDSLRLFTPGRYDGLPGMPFPGSPSSYPTKDETALARSSRSPLSKVFRTKRSGREKSVLTVGVCRPATAVKGGKPRKKAEKVGVREIVFRPFSVFRFLLPTLASVAA